EGLDLRQQGQVDRDLVLAGDEQQQRRSSTPVEAFELLLPVGPGQRRDRFLAEAREEGRELLVAADVAGRVVLPANPLEGLTYMAGGQRGDHPAVLETEARLEEGQGTFHGIVAEGARREFE